MDDLTMTKLCAEAMKLRYKTHEDNEDVNYNFPGVYLYDSGSNMWNRGYYPLSDDAQAMALVKRFRLFQNYVDSGGWAASLPNEGVYRRHGDDLNRAIVECCARMQQAKESNDGC